AVRDRQAPSLRNHARAVLAVAAAWRPARSGPVHPHRRREAHQQLPALEPRLHGTVFLRRAVARLRRGRLRGGAGVLRLAPAPLRPHGGAGLRQRRGRMTGTRVISAVFIAAALLITVLWLPPVWSVAMLSLVLLAAGWEWSGFVGTGAWPRTAFLVLLAVLCALWW